MHYDQGSLVNKFELRSGVVFIEEHQLEKICTPNPNKQNYNSLCLRWFITF